MHRSKPRLHSITSSASSCIELGTLRPSALAVLMLITSWYLVGSCTGRSVGFAPRRMRSTTLPTESDTQVGEGTEDINCENQLKSATRTREIVRLEQKMRNMKVEQTDNHNEYAAECLCFTFRHRVMRSAGFIMPKVYL